jgi:hypothetical protein
MTSVRHVTRWSTFITRLWFITVILWGGGAVLSAVATQQSAGSVVSLSGLANVTGPVHPSVTPLKVRDDVHRGDEISTAAQSLVRLRLGSSTTVTVRELSTMTLQGNSDRVRM